jgi:hypothetical protein
MLLVGNGKEVINITWDVAQAFGEPVKQRGEYVQDAGLYVQGCGMDMCFHTVYNLGRTLFPDGFGEAGFDGQAGIRRPKTSEEAAEMVKAGWGFRGRNGDTSGWDNDGGYALNKRDL